MAVLTIAPLSARVRAPTVVLRVACAVPHGFPCRLQVTAQSTWKKSVASIVAA
jgi:hypothetical protein